MNDIYQALIEEITSVPGLKTEPGVHPSLRVQLKMVSWQQLQSTSNKISDHKINGLQVNHFDKDGVRSYRGYLYISTNSELVIIRENLVKFIVSMYDPECVDKIKAFLAQRPKQWESMKEKLEFCKSTGANLYNNYHQPTNICD